MNDIIYLSLSNEGMTVEDVVVYAKFFRKLHIEYSDWSFDQITGGVGEFLDEQAYFYIKNLFDEKNE